MGTKVFGRVCLTSDLTGSSKEIYQPFFPRRDIILRGMRVSIVMFNDPVFTGFKCSLYGNDSVTDLPSTKIAESSKVWEKADILTLDNGFFEIYFDFADIALQADTRYHFVFNANSYTGTDSSHIAMRVAYPRPVYETGLTITPEKIQTMPILLYLIGAEY
jgi:hypothetical protein